MRVLSPPRGHSATRPREMEGSRPQYVWLKAYFDGVTPTIDAGAVVMQPTGRINAVNAPKLREDLLALVAGANTLVVVDLSDVESLDSAGLGALIAGLKATRRAGGALRIAAPTAKVLMVLAAANLTTAFKPYESTASAMADR